MRRENILKRNNTEDKCLFVQGVMLISWDFLGNKLVVVEFLSDSYVFLEDYDKHARDMFKMLTEYLSNLIARDNQYFCHQKGV